jgi:hypothetical protein
MKNIPMSTDLTRAANRTWDQISPDAGYCHIHEAAELVLDRLPHYEMAEAKALIAEYGYVKVRNALARVL